MTISTPLVSNILKKIRMKIVLIGLCLMLLLSLFVFVPKTSAENLFEDACKTGAAKNSPVCKQVQEQKTSGQNPISGPHGIIQQAANIFALVAAVGGTILIVYGGFVFATAGGSRAGDNATRARQARTIIVSALTGMVIVAFAWLIVTFVNTRVIG